MISFQVPLHYTYLYNRRIVTDLLVYVLKAERDILLR